MFVRVEYSNLVELCILLYLYENTQKSGGCYYVNHAKVVLFATTLRLWAEQTLRNGYIFNTSTRRVIVQNV